MAYTNCITYKNIAINLIFFCLVIIGKVQILIFCTSGLVKEEGLFDNIKYFTIRTIWLANMALSNNVNKSYRIQLDCKWNMFFEFNHA